MSNILKKKLWLNLVHKNWNFLFFYMILKAKCHYSSTSGSIVRGGSVVKMRLILLANYIVFDPAFYGPKLSAAAACYQCSQVSALDLKIWTMNCCLHWFSYLNKSSPMYWSNSRKNDMGQVAAFSCDSSRPFLCGSKDCRHHNFLRSRSR